MADVSTEIAIATQTLGSAASSITFSSIPSTYTDLRLVVTATAASGGQDVGMQFNGDTASNYSITSLQGDGGTATSSRITGFGNYRITYNGLYTSTTIPINIQTDIFSYAGSTYKTGLSTASGDLNGSGVVARNVGLWRSTSAITSLSIICGVNFNIGTTATLYGIL
jgi:hypothetical protein